MRFFLDEGVPDPVGKVFSARGHLVILMREAIDKGSPDALVCAAAEANDAILVACDGDMKQLAKRYGVGAGRFRKLNLIKFTTTAPRYVSRAQQAMSLIEHEWGISELRQSRRLYIEIMTDIIRIMR